MTLGARTDRRSAEDQLPTTAEATATRPRGWLPDGRRETAEDVEPPPLLASHVTRTPTVQD